jgi:type I restriction-modification system DNA methylase subunit
VVSNSEAQLSGSANFYMRLKALGDKVGERSHMSRSTKLIPTSPQAKLSAVIKSARDAMRKDAGLNGDLDRIPQLAWLLFLKAYDGLEERREVTDRRFRPAIDAPYRWRDWAADPVNGITGEELLEFVNGDLLPYLRGLTGTRADDPRDVIAAVFKETHNRMLSGYLLRDVVNKVNEVNFASSDDIHTMARLYESMLKRCAMPLATQGSFIRQDPSFVSWFSRSRRNSARQFWTPRVVQRVSLSSRSTTCGPKFEASRSFAPLMLIFVELRRSHCLISLAS